MGRQIADTWKNIRKTGNSVAASMAEDDTKLVLNEAFVKCLMIILPTKFSLIMF